MQNFSAMIATIEKKSPEVAAAAGHLVAAHGVAIGNGYEFKVPTFEWASQLAEAIIGQICDVPTGKPENARWVSIVISSECTQEESREIARGTAPRTFWKGPALSFTERQMLDLTDALDDMENR